MSDPHTQSDATDDAVIGRAFWGSLGVILALGIIGGGVVYWSRAGKPEAADVTAPLVLPAKREVVPVEVPRVRFTDITGEAGIAFVHESGAAGDKLLPETMGSGAAFFDFDNDGDQDLLLVNSCPWQPPRESRGTKYGAGLYRNDGTGHFDDVTAGSGLDITCYGMGVAVGDYDNDGWRDVFISALSFPTSVKEGGRAGRLFHNEQGKFVEVTETAGVGGRAGDWCTACGWFDYNNDGLLDLFVCRYVKWSREIDLAQDFKLVGIGRAYGPPFSFEGTFPILYRNEGNGKFSDVSAEAGVQIKNSATGVPMAKSLGLTFVDLDRDGWLDVVVANDTVQNFVFHNQRDGTFREIGAISGVAFDSAGNARGAMGIDAARFRNDGALGIAIGNFANEMTALYVSHGKDLLFTDEAIATGLGPPSRLELKFGVFFFDYDLDGRLDLFAANGHLEEEIHKVQQSQRHAQLPHLFWNAGQGHGSEFVLTTPEQTGPDFHQPLVGRGATFADIDADGDLDVLITANHGSPRLLRNDQELGHHWLRFHLTGTRSNRDAIGTWIEVHLGDRVLARQVMPTRSYLSQCELPVTIGIGEATKVEQVRIVWPDGTAQTTPNIELDRSQIITQNAP